MRIRRSVAPMMGLLLAFSGCAGSGRSREVREMDVYAAVLDTMAASGTRRLVVRPVHAAPIYWLTMESHGPRHDSATAVKQLVADSVPVELARDFVAVNRRPDPLHTLPHTRMRVDFDTLPPLTDAVRDSITRTWTGRRWAGFEWYQRAYPGATARVALSHVGFSPDGTHALVYVEGYCGMLCGGGMIITLQRLDGRWRVVNEYSPWVT